MVTRLEPRNQIKPKVKTPSAPHEWDRLMQAVLDKAILTRDPRLPGLRRILESGKVEKHLRKMGIVCQADIDREFPGQ